MWTVKFYANDQLLWTERYLFKAKAIEEKIEWDLKPNQYAEIVKGKK